MSAQDWVIVISAATGGLAAVIGAIFAGLVALKQMPEAKQRREEIAKETKDGA